MLSIIMRFFWAIMTAIDLYEPRYRIKQVYAMGQALIIFADGPAVYDQKPRDPDL
jgi:hypothetical protein